MTANTHEDILRTVVLGLLTNRNLDELLENVIRSAGRIVNTTHGCIDLVDEKTGQLNTRVPMGMFRDITRVPVKKGDGLSGKVWQSGEFLIINNYDVSEGRLPTFRQGIIRSAIGIPLKPESGVIGVLILAHDIDSDQVFDQKDVESLNFFAVLATLIIQNMLLYEAAVLSADRRTALYNAAQEISASFNIDQVCGAIHHAAEQLMPCDDFVIDLYEEASNKIYPLYVMELGKKTTPPSFFADHGLGGQVVHSGKSVLFNNTEQIESSGIKFEPYGNNVATVSVLAVPVKLKGKIIGMISAQSYQPQAYTQDDQELLEMLATHAAIAFENVRLFAQSQKYASTDSLTTIYNRRRFFELAEREFKRAVRFERPLAMIMLDIDDFKKVNDSYGHPAGDRVLSEMAKICLYELRDVDIFGRYGGDEFIVILPETTPAQATGIAERLRVEIQNAKITLPNSAVITVTISLGVVSLGASCGNLSILIERADQALYKSKQSGRNQVNVWTSGQSQQIHMW
jgi:diguanylate cyclase (GGDEF)-like protein